MVNSNLDFASIAKFFVFLLIGVSMLMGLDSMGTPGTNDTMYGVYHTVSSLISSGYGMFAIGGIIIGAAAVLSFTDYI